MSLSDLASLAVIIQTLFLVVSIGIIWYQLRENARLARASHLYQFYEIWAPFHLQRIQDPELVRLWVEGEKHYEHMNEINKERYISLLSYYFNIFEVVHVLKRERFFNEKVYASLTAFIPTILALPHFHYIWKTMKVRYEASFVDYIDHLLKEHQHAHLSPQA